MRVQNIYQPKTITPNFNGKLTIKDWPEELKTIQTEFEKYAQEKAKKIDPDLLISGWKMNMDRRINFNICWSQNAKAQDGLDYTSGTTLNEIKNAFDRSILKHCGVV